MLTIVMRRACAIVLSASLVAAPVPQAAASMIGTADAIALDRHAGALASAQAALARDDVRARLVSLGVDPAEVESRLAALTPEEMTLLSDRLDELPAGSGVLAVLGIVLIVLLVLEYTGAIDIFKKVP